MLHIYFLGISEFSRIAEESGS